MSGYNYPLGSGAETWEDVRAALNLGPLLCLARGPGPAWWGPAPLSPTPEECHLGHRVSWLKVTSVLGSQPLYLAQKGPRSLILLPMHSPPSALSVGA